jgi:CRISPR-associated endonuclease/helicase Cas3
MMVTFVSQCEKKALSRTRRVLDAFANRIGDNTWQTIITEDGLLAVKQLLRKTVTKNTAVSCHWIRSRSRSELVWIVGNRNKFNKEGFVPVNSTKKSILNNEWENNWTYLPLIKALVAVAALLHDWGKATLLFQQKLKVSSKEGDPLRHEWISCLLLNALIEQSGDKKDDTAWLSLLSNNTWNEAQLQASPVKISPNP